MIRVTKQWLPLLSSAASLALSVVCGCAAPLSGDIPLADFEGAHYTAGWTVTGTAFGEGPAHGTLDRQQTVSGFLGQGLVNSYRGEDGATGTLTSAKFVINRVFLSFLIGGGHNPAEERMDLIIDGKSVRTATGNDAEMLSWKQWDVADLKGKTAILRISDLGTGSWGHISIDAVTLTNGKLKVLDERTDALVSAGAAIRAAMPVAAGDPRRPAYHYHAPAQWMNDPNGPIYDKGWYHVFYQFNPYGAQWGSIHWGHARSRDLVNWQQMPVALWPSKSRGEDHVFSGSVFPRADGTPMAFYTSIGAGRDPEQWGAISSSPDLSVWSKSPANPLLTTKIHGEADVKEWRDPFLFAQNGITYMLTGGGIHKHGVVNLYEATTPTLTAWKYLGVLFQHPDTQITNIECPNLAYIDGKWLLLTSTYGKVESFVGQIDLTHRQFLTEKRGVLAEGAYASQLMRGPDGSVIHLAWMHTEQGKGWNGYLTLPSTLHIGSDDTVRRWPVAALTKLRGRHIHFANQDVGQSWDLTPQITGQISGKSLEMIADIDPGKSSSIMIHLRASADGSRSVALRYDTATRTLSVPGRAPVVLPGGDSSDLKLRLFLDNGALDVYAEEGLVTLASFLPDIPPSDTGIRISAVGGMAEIKSLDLYEMKPATFDNSLLNALTAAK